MRPAFPSLSIALMAACAVQPQTEPLPPPNPGGSFELVFDGVVDGRLDEAHTCHGEGSSPPVAWSNLPEGTRSLSWVMQVEGQGVTWTAWDPKLDAGEVPAALHAAAGPPIQSWADEGALGYQPPCPGPGELRRAQFRIWALSAPLGLPPTADRASAHAARDARNLGTVTVKFTVHGPAEP